MFPLLLTLAVTAVCDAADRKAPRRDTGPDGLARDYWIGQRGAPTFDQRPWREVVAEMPADYWPLHWPARKVAKPLPTAKVEASPTPPVATIATVKPKAKRPRATAPVAAPVPTPETAPAPVSDVPGLRLTAPVRKAATPEREDETVAPPFTGCKDHPVTRSGYCTRCAEMEDAE